MHKQEEFEVYRVRKELATLIDDFENSAWDDRKNEAEIVFNEIKDIIEKIVKKPVKNGGFGFDKAYKIVSNFYPEESEKFEYAIFTISLASKDKLEIEKYNKKTFKIEAGIDFFDNVIIELAEFFDECFIAKMLQDNLDEFNEIIMDIIKENDPKFLNNKEKSRLKLLEYLGDSFDFDSLLDNRLTLESIVDAATLLIWAIQENKDKFNKSTGEYSEETKEDIINHISEDLFKYKYYRLLKSNRRKELLERTSKERIKNIKTDEVEFDQIFDALSGYVEILNETTEEIQIADTKLNISFGLGEGFIDVSDNYAVVGLSEDVIKELNNLPLFDKMIESRAQGYREILKNTLVQCQKSHDIVKVKSIVTDENNLNIYDRKELHNIFKEYSHRPVYSTKARVGVSYYETATDFAVLEKTAIDANEASRIKESKWIKVIDNEKPNSDEVKDKKTKIKVEFKIRPYNKSTNKEVDITIDEVLNYRPETDEVAN